MSILGPGNEPQRHLRAVPAFPADMDPLDGLRREIQEQRARAQATYRSDEDRVAAARDLARRSATGRDLIERLDAAGTRIELLPDADFRELHPRSPGGARIRELAPLQTLHGVVYLNHQVTIHLPWSSALRAEEGALMLVQQAALADLERPGAGGPARDAIAREAHAAVVRARVAHELGVRDGGPGTGPDGAPLPVRQVEAQLRAARERRADAAAELQQREARGLERLRRDLDPARR